MRELTAYWDIAPVIARFVNHHFGQPLEPKSA